MVTYDTLCLYSANVYGHQGGAKVGISVNSDIKEESIAEYPLAHTNARRDALSIWAGKAPAYPDLTELSGVAAARSPGSQITIDKRQFVMLQAVDPDIKIYYRYSDVEVSSNEPVSGYYDDTESKVNVNVEEDSLVIVCYHALPDPANNDREPMIRIKVNDGLSGTWARTHLPRTENNWLGMFYFFEAAPGTYEIQGAFGLASGGVYHSIKKRFLAAMVIPLDYNFDYWYENKAQTLSSSYYSTISGCHVYTKYPWTIFDQAINLPSDATVIFLGHLTGRKGYLYDKNYGVAGGPSWKLTIDGATRDVVSHYSMSYRSYADDNHNVCYLLYAENLSQGGHTIELDAGGAAHPTGTCSTNYAFYLWAYNWSYCILAIYKE